MLYDVTSSDIEGSCCSLAHLGHSRDCRKGTLQAVYGLLCAPDRCPTAIKAFADRTSDPKMLATQVGKLKHRFGLNHVALVGNRGVVTQARLTEEVKTAGLEWITALRGPAIKGLVTGGVLPLSLFDERDMTSITSSEFPDERLIVCGNPGLAAQRAQKMPGTGGRHQT